MAFCRTRISNVLALALTALAASCNEPPQQQSQTPQCTPSKAASLDETAAQSEDDTEPSTEVTFYGDLLPILASVETGKVYKCTTCHAHYEKPDGMNNVRELERVVESMKIGRMPRVGDRVPSAKIELFTMWRLQGFKDGTPKTAARSDSTSPAQSQDAKPASSTSSGCK